jgi:2-octaprenyl-6-methoxyphenol hydroxylase
MGVWAALAPTPIQQVHVSQHGGFGRAAISADETGVPALGYVVDYGAMFAVLTEAARGSGCRYLDGARVTAVHREGDLQRIDYTQDGVAASLMGHLTAVADGGNIDGLAPVKVIDYKQHALTARVRVTLPHRNVAYERFTPEGPLVWTLTPERAQALLAADAAVFLGALRLAFGARLGDFVSVTQRAAYPLTLRYTPVFAGATAPGVVTLGNAAQTLHPVAGQGFNLGLRDAWELARTLRAIPAPRFAHHDTVRSALREYRAARRTDRYATVAATHGLVQLFSNDYFPLRAMRGAGLTLIGSIAPLRDFLARRMIFGAHG